MSDDHQSPTRQPATLAAQGMGGDSEPFHEVAPPIRLSTTYERSPDGSLPGGRLYARDESPAYDQAEALLCALEGGAAAALFPSGMAAASAVLQGLKLGDRLLVPRSMYWGLRNWFVRFTAQWGIGLDFYANDDLGHLATKAKDHRPHVVWAETPANPTWEVTDIAAAADIAHSVGARLVVDSTVATPVLTRPIALGADLVMHSATKYLNGHTDVVAGALITAREDEFWARIHASRSAGGAILGPFEAWLLLRGMRTLYVRVAASCRNAQALAEHFARHPAVAAVLYPGLPSHPGHAIAARQMEGGYGGMLSLRLRGGEAAARETAGRLRLFKRATSLGSVESLVEHRAPVEGPGSLCPTDLLRFSIGIESVQDLIADLEQALRQ